LSGTTQFQLQVEAEDETCFKLYDASIIFLLKNAYPDNIPSSYITYIPKNSTISYCLYLYWNCYSLRSKNGASGPMGGSFIALSIKGNRREEREGGWGGKA
jgi:hypothetical protein